MKQLYEKCLELFKKYKETILYLVFGGLTTLINIVSFWALNKLLVLSMDKDTALMVSNAAAWVISVLFAFVTNKLFVFESKSLHVGLVLKELVLFVGARLFSGALDMGIMYLFVSILGFNELVIKILSNILVIIINYVLSKLIIFKKKK
ncbi:GtrA family protein [Acetanaerobacterium elongatum]|uniref:Putative flippase GtrA (Transmembrane translocase of bactoprenol-linked glucose) n=1 Tax=Acetanaerobacterium elongatum TaxID=258515 RepID=A0A1G9ZTP1_9FIRM|nr:GtrA family protein [Acetanaerobacterium elongatum]SDN24477.1 Putative flippase GtrA (transmembrane translocase of bactoprenol-linked glucose) [Acetanaerobacterium elongatum]